MKTVLSLGLISLFCQQSFGTALCPKNRLGQGEVRVENSNSVVVSGLQYAGVTSGRYNCEVKQVGPGFLSIQSRATCLLQGGQFEAIQVWFIQGASAFGTPAASISVYNHVGVS